MVVNREDWHSYRPVYSLKYPVLSSEKCVTLPLVRKVCAFVNSCMFPSWLTLFLPLLSGMRILVTLLLDTLPMLGNVLLLCFFVFFIFGIVGVQLWAGLLRNRCFVKENFSLWVPCQHCICVPVCFQSCVHFSTSVMLRLMLTAGSILGFGYSIIYIMSNLIDICGKYLTFVLLLQFWGTLLEHFHFMPLYTSPNWTERELSEEFNCKNR